MADNLETQAGSGGPLVATDEIGGVHHARSKTGWGSDGTYTDVDLANPLPVQGPLTLAQLVAAIVQVLPQARVADYWPAYGGTTDTGTAELNIDPGAGEGAAPPQTGPTPAGRGSNLRDIWEFRDKPFAVRVKGKRKAYRTARQAATAVKEALRTAPADAVSVELEGQPVSLPALEFAPFRDVLARLLALEERREQAAENQRRAQAAERERIRRAQEADDEEALVLLLRAWRL